MTASAVLPRSRSLALPADVVVPSHLWVPDEYNPERSLGPEVAAMCELSGYSPDPEQRFLLDLAFALDKSGKLLIFQLVVIAPRQNLKTGFLKQYDIGQMFVLERPLTAWTAHEFDTVTEAQLDLERIIDGSSDLRGKVKRYLHGSSPEIELTNGARTIFRTRTAGKGRGISGEPVITDEGFALTGPQMGALLPIMMAQNNPQWVVASSGCRSYSVELWRMIQAGRVGGSRRMAYVEYCAPEPEQACDLGKSCDHQRGRPGCGCDKPEVLERFHTALHRGRGSIQSRWDLRETLPPDEYCMEIMGWHAEAVKAEDVINAARWAELALPDAGQPAELSWALDVSPDRTVASVAASGLLPSGRRLGFVVDSVDPVDVLELLRGLRTDKGLAVLVADEIAVGENLLTAIENDGFVVRRLKLAGAAAAYSQLRDDMRSGVFAHLDDPMLNVAVTSAGVRNVGDGGQALQRRGAEHITPLVAVTLANAQRDNTEVWEVWT